MDKIEKKVLVVEDDDMLRSVIRDQLARQYAVLAARDGEEALQIIEAQKPDVIVLDLMLPKLDGFQVMEKLRSMQDPALAKMPVIVVSNLADPASIARAQGYNVEAYFTKADITVGILLNRVKRILNPPV